MKIFLDAAPGSTGEPSFQATRSENESKVTEESVLKELRERDARDRNRAQSPLKPAEDAVILDSTAMTLDDVLAAAEAIVRSHVEAAKLH